jgi:hypothetical protein
MICVKEGMICLCVCADVCLLVFACNEYSLSLLYCTDCTRQAPHPRDAHTSPFAHFITSLTLKLTLIRTHAHNRTPRYKSIDNDSKPFLQLDVEDPFLWQDKRGNFHALHHWQSPGSGALNGGHSFSHDGVHWNFSQTPACVLPSSC